MFRWAVLMFPMLAHCIMSPEFLSSHIRTHEYDSGDLVHQSEGELSTIQNLGLKFEQPNESYYVYDTKVYRFQKRLNQVIVYDQIPDVAKSFHWLINPRSMMGSYQMTQEGQVVTLKSYAGHETIMIQLDAENHPEKISWEKDHKKFIVTLGQVSTEPFPLNRVKPLFSENTDIINFGDSYE